MAGTTWLVPTLVAPRDFSGLGSRVAGAWKGGVRVVPFA